MKKQMAIVLWTVLSAGFSGARAQEGPSLNLNLSWGNQGRPGEAAPRLRKIPPQGHLTSDGFDDTRRAYESGKPIRTIIIRGGDIVDQIQAFNGKVEMPRHGGEGGGGAVIQLDRGDRLTRIDGYYGNWYGHVFISQVYFHTVRGRVYGPFGKNGGVRDLRSFQIQAPEGWQIVALTGCTGQAPESDGRFSTYLSALGAGLAPLQGFERYR